jgi:hypothetical protein
MKSLEEEHQDQMLRELLKRYCDEKDVSRTPIGWLIRPKQGLRPGMRGPMHELLVTKMGATYSQTADSFLLAQIPTSKEVKKQPTRLGRILLGDLVHGYQPRLTVDDLSIEPLYADMRVNGQKERIIVRVSQKFEGKYEMIKGNRRKRCAEMLLNEDSPFDWTGLDAEIRDLTDQEAYALVLSLFNRKELSSFELGRYFKQGMQEFPKLYPTQLSIGKAFGYKSNSRVSELISYYEEEQARIDSLKPKAKPQLKPAEPAADKAEEKKTVARATEDNEKTVVAAENVNENKENICRQINQQQTNVAAEAEASPAAESPIHEETEHDETENLPIPSPEHAKIIRGAPAEFQPALRKAAAAGASKRDLQALAQEAELTQATPEEALKGEQTDFARQEKIEEAKKRGLINSVKKTYPFEDPLLQDLAEHFNRVKFSGVTAEKLGKLAFKLVSLEHQAAKEAGRLEEFLKKLEEEM